jgi:O-methyltransferase involved in polyketide biosynthesis
VASVFNKVSELLTAAPSSQIINIGAGFDTLYWRLHVR